MALLPETDPTWSTEEGAKSRGRRTVLEQVLSYDTAKVFFMMLGSSLVLTKVTEMHEESVNTAENILQERVYKPNTVLRQFIGAYYTSLQTLCRT